MIFVQYLTVAFPTPNWGNFVTLSLLPKHFQFLLSSTITMFPFAYQVFKRLFNTNSVRVNEQPTVNSENINPNRNTRKWNCQTFIIKTNGHSCIKYYTSNRHAQSNRVNSTAPKYFILLSAHGCLATMAPRTSTCIDGPPVKVITSFSAGIPSSLSQSVVHSIFHIQYNNVKNIFRLIRTGFSPN